MATQAYRSASRRLLEQARAELAAGDVPQASEKGWGGAAQMVKAVAQRRGWRHIAHRHLFHAVGRLGDETGNANIPRLFAVANDLHINFYEDWLETHVVVQHLGDVEQLVDLLEPLG